MPGSSKKPENESSTKLPDWVATPEQLRELGLGVPETAGHLPDRKDEPERPLYLISFEFYKPKICQIGQLDGNGPPRLLDIFKSVGTTVRANSDLHRLQYTMDSVKNAGGYKGLYNNIPKEGKIFEYHIVGRSRLFFYPKEVDGKFHVIAIRTAEGHLETDKVRR